jgi:4,5-dihydroxyphthalate decarboxylase
VRDLVDGTVSVAGVDLNVLRLPIEEMFYRFLVHGEFDVSEVSLAKIAALAAQDDPRFVALPVFTSRVFRHSSIYVRSEAGITKPEELAGKRSRRARMGANRRASTRAGSSRTNTVSISLRSIGIRPA